MTGAPWHPGRAALDLAEQTVRHPPADITATALDEQARIVRLWSSDLDAIAAADRIGTLVAEGSLT